MDAMVCFYILTKIHDPKSKHTHIDPYKTQHNKNLLYKYFVGQFKSEFYLP